MEVQEDGGLVVAGAQDSLLKCDLETGKELVVVRGGEDDGFCVSEYALYA